MDNVERFIRDNWRGCEREEDIPNPYPPEWGVNTRVIIERNVGIKRDEKYPAHKLLFGYNNPEFFDVGSFFKPADRVAWN